MAIQIHDVPFDPIPTGATEEQRQLLFAEWTQRFKDANPAYFYPDGRRRHGMRSSLIDFILHGCTHPKES